MTTMPEITDADRAALKAAMAMPAVVQRPLGWFFPDERNPREITDAELEGLADDIATFGMVQNLCANRDGMMIGGHQRHEATRRALMRPPRTGRPWQLGLTVAQVAHYEVPAAVLDLAMKRARILNLALNKRGGGWDFAKLVDVLDDLDGIDIEEVKLSGFDEREIEDMRGLLSGPSEGGGAGPTTDTRTSPRRFTIEVPTDVDANVCRDALRLFGMQGSGEGAARAFVAVCKAAQRHAEQHPEAIPADTTTKPARKQRRRKAKP